jgi:hypothetical protein
LQSARKIGRTCFLKRENRDICYNGACLHQTQYRYKKNEISSAAALGLNVNYWISNKFALGVHSDMIFESFIIEEKNGELENNFIEREYPLSVNAVVTYTLYIPWDCWQDMVRSSVRRRIFLCFLLGQNIW